MRLILFLIMMKFCGLSFSHQEHSYHRQHQLQQHSNIPVKLDGDTSKYLNFQLILPNNKTLHVRVHLSIQLENQPLKNYLSRTTLKPLIRNSRWNNEEEEKLFSIDDAIEAFRKDLIEKETNIGGIIESSNIFFRHFNLKYENIEIRLRCRYYSNYQYRKLNIYCFQYDPENQKDRFSYEKTSYNQASPLFNRNTNIHDINDINERTINMEDYLQTLHMTIQ